MNHAPLRLAGEAGTDRFAARLAQALPREFFYLALHGELGAGKTHLARGLLRALGETGPVRSPTYTLLEAYAPGGWPVLHLDLYRLADGEELEYLGLRERIGEPLTLLVEWPERGAGNLPPPDLSLHLSIVDDRTRRLDLEAGSDAGRRCLEALAATPEQSSAGESSEIR